MAETHEKEAPGSAYSGNETVEVLPLDEALHPHCEAEERIFLKIDTQGYEKSVLQGANQVLDRCAAVQMELSLTRLYEGGFLFAEGVQWMESRGFELYAIFPGFCDRKTGQTFQADGVFVPKT